MKRDWDNWDRAGLVLAVGLLIAAAFQLYRLIVRLGPLIYPAT